MKMLILFIFTILSSNAFSDYNIKEFWDKDYTPKIGVTCTNKDKFCTNLCKNKTYCEFPQVTCRDCISTSILMTNIFENMSVFYRNSGETAPSIEFINFLKSKNYVSFSSRSIYNQTDSFDSAELQTRFQNLCPNFTKYPVVFFNLKENSNILNEAQYVACDSNVYKMTTDKDIVSEEPLMLKMDLQLKSFRSLY
jgi:hypothetical protein